MNWTQNEAIAFECAREAITDLMAVRFAELRAEEDAASPRRERISELDADLARLGRERQALTVDQKDWIEQIRTTYGEQVRAARAQHTPDAA